MVVWRLKYQLSVQCTLHAKLAGRYQEIEYLHFFFLFIFFFNMLFASNKANSSKYVKRSTTNQFIQASHRPLKRPVEVQGMAWIGTVIAKICASRRSCVAVAGRGLDRNRQARSRMTCGEASFA